MKPKRNTELDEIKLECTRRSGSCFHNGTCAYKSFCVERQNTPLSWDLTDQPRFTEAQMALFKWWYECGATWAGLDWDAHVGDVVVFRNDKEQQVGNMQNTNITLWFKENESFLDLAELFGKEGAK